MTSSDYPTWICDDCATNAGKPQLRRMATFHTDQCDICHQVKAVTEPRDYGHFSEAQLATARAMVKREKNS